MGDAARAGLKLSRATMAQWIAAMRRLLVPTGPALNRHVLAASVPARQSVGSQHWGEEMLALCDAMAVGFVVDAALCPALEAPVVTITPSGSTR
jgi:hypothetical protein